jgi:hypothetical protein
MGGSIGEGRGAHTIGGIGGRKGAQAKGSAGTGKGKGSGKASAEGSEDKGKGKGSGTIPPYHPFLFPMVPLPSEHAHWRKTHCGNQVFDGTVERFGLGFGHNFGPGDYGWIVPDTYCALQPLVQQKMRAMLRRLLLIHPGDITFEQALLFFWVRDVEEGHNIIAGSRVRFRCYVKEHSHCAGADDIEVVP